MRPCLACEAFLLAVFLSAGRAGSASWRPRGSLPPRYNSMASLRWPIPAGSVTQAVHSGGGGPTVNETIVNNNTTYGYSPSYYNGAGLYGGYGYGNGGLYVGGLGFGGLGYGGYYGMGGLMAMAITVGLLAAYTALFRGMNILPAGAVFGPQPIQQMLAGAAMPAVDPGPLGGRRRIPRSTRCGCRTPKPRPAPASSSTRAMVYSPIRLSRSTGAR